MIYNIANSFSDIHKKTPTCLFRTRRSPRVSPVSVFCVATGISSLSFTGGVSPLDIARKYLHKRTDISDIKTYK